MFFKNASVAMGWLIMNNMVKRIYSALILIPVVVCVTIFGMPWFDILFGVVALFAIAEWFIIPQKAHITNTSSTNEFRIQNIAENDRHQAYVSAFQLIKPWLKILLTGLAVLFLIVLGLFYHQYIKPDTTSFIHSLSDGLRQTFQSYMYLLGAFILMLVVIVAVMAKVQAIFLCFLGFVYISSAYFAILWLRYQNEDGIYYILWLFLSVWATDIFAMIIGKNLQGPKLAPKISPNKTWSGLIAGILASALVSGVFAFCLKSPYPFMFIIWGALFAVIEQIGDLIESAYKRVFKVKDSGQLIPGHGGVLDRIDGLLLLSIVMAIIIDLSDISWWRVE